MLVAVAAVIAIFNRGAGALNFFAVDDCTGIGYNVAGKNY